MRALRRGTNLSRVAGFNEAVVIDAIRRARDGLSRVEISGQTGLSAQTVSNIVRRMLESGLLQEGDRVTQGLGKPRTPLTLHPDGRYAVGVHLDPLMVTIVLVNLRGEVAAHVQRPSPASAEPSEVVADIAAQVPLLLERAGVGIDLVAGLGFASPGPINTEHGTVLDPPHLPHWRYVPVADELAERLGLPVVLDKDVVAAAVGERWTGATLGQANSLFLYLSTGIGAGVAVDDTILRGSTGNAGDIGHLIVDARGPACHCGQQGCIGVTLSPAALVESAVAARVLGGAHLDAVRSADPARVDSSFAALCELVDAGDAGAVGVVDASAVQLAKAITTLANMFDTDVVAVGGPTWMRLGKVYLPRLDDLVQPGLVHRPGTKPVSVVGTALGEDVIAVGAACLVLDHEFAPAVSSIALAH
ncbi:MAG: ROK family transcriptional regulator [Actinobacteria bacterium]|nr:ROK family transcriptional regulator [Actinomycetota bacterium]